MQPIYANILLHTQKMHVSKLSTLRSQAEFYLEKARINGYLHQFSFSEHCNKDMNNEIKTRVFTDTLVLTNLR